MSQITWRNVDAPSFSGVGDSIRTFSNMLGNATAGLSNALGDFRNSARQQAGDAIMAEAMRYQDPNEYRNALASGALFAGYDPSLISSRTMENLDNRAGNLLDQASKQQNLDFTRYSNDRTMKVNAATDAAAPALQELALAYQSGDPRKVQAAQAQYGDVLKTLPAGVVMDYMNNLQGQGTAGIGQRRSLFNLGVDMRNDADTQAAMQLLNNIRRGAYSADDARMLAEGTFDQMSPGAVSRALSQLDRAYPGAYTPGTGSASLSPPGTQGTRNGSAYDTTYKFTPTDVPITQMNLGEVVQHQDTMKKTLGASPVGAYQINQDTLKDFAPKVFGEDWQNIPMSPENQDKLGEAIFNARKNGNLKSTWAALPDDTPGAYKNLSWDEMKDYIAQAETGNSINPLQEQAFTSVAGNTVGTRNMQNIGNTLLPEYQAATVDPSTTGQVAKRIIDSNELKGINQGALVRQINEVAKQNAISPAMAGAIIQRSITGKPEGWFSGIRNAFDTDVIDLGGDYQLDKAAVEANAKLATTGTAIEQNARNQLTAQIQSNIYAAQNTLDTALADLREVQRRIQTGQENLRSVLPRYQERVNTAKRLLDGARSAVAADPQNLDIKSLQNIKQEESEANRRSLGRDAGRRLGIPDIFPR